MPKTKISEYSTVNTDNSDIESINIAEGCAPSGINNAIRELMVHLKEFQTGASGDAFTFAGGVLISGSLNTATGAMIMSGANVIAHAAGTVSAPSIYANGDTNTGIFFPAADTIAFAEGGVEAMRINSFGQVGIGTTSPATSLTISGATQDGTTGIRVINTNTAGYSTVDLQNTGTSGKSYSLGVGGNTAGSNQNSFYVFDSTASATRMVIDSSGNVGIGTSSPSQKLHVVGSSLVTPTGGWTAGGVATQYFGDVYGSIKYDYDTTNFKLSSYGFISFATDGTTPTERMRITSSGNVGIGTTSPVSKLDVLKAGNSAGGTIMMSGSKTNNSIKYGNLTGAHYANSTYPQGICGIAVLSTADDNFVDIGGNVGEQIASNTIRFWTAANTTTGGGTERARITSGGYFKASNTGTYVSSTGTYHEFTNSANGVGLISYSTNASFTSTTLLSRTARAANSAFSLYEADTGDGADREFQLRGDGNGYADGTWNNNGADYAEFFESANGQALTLGATVVLDGNKVREATEQDPTSAIIGVVRPKEPSKASMVVGNTAWNKWANKYLTDDFDRYIMEDHDVVEWEEQVLEKEAVAAVEAVVDKEGNEVSPAVPAQEAVYKTVKHSYESHNIPEGITVPADAVRKTHDDKGNKFQHYKLNPAWDKDAEYTPREQRPEWNIIGLVGQVKVLKGQPTNDRWIKMRDVSATVEEWFIR